ncbi:MAG: hypothetical protein J6N72_02625 [Psychrobacter sp.]|nr:hypothetical protein [Psychrobacter sp.]
MPKQTHIPLIESYLESKEAFKDCFLFDAFGKTPRELTEAIIINLGGDNCFMNCYQQIAKKGIGDGYYFFTYPSELMKFFDANEEQIFYTVDGMSHLVGAHSVVLYTHKRIEKYSVDEVAKGLYQRHEENGLPSTIRSNVCGKLVTMCVEHVCQDFLDFANEAA